MTRPRSFGPDGLRAALVALALLGACTSDGSARPSPTGAAATASTVAGPSTGAPDPPAIDTALAERSIAVTGAVRVGEPLHASISEDLAGEIESWGWHRCIQVPTCQTVAGADTATYTPTVDDAWQILRVIAVARREGSSASAVTVVVGPVVNPDPEAFHVEAEVDPSATTGTRTIVAPGQATITVDADCPVEVVAGIRTAAPDDSTLTAEFQDEAASAHHRFTLEGGGGELTVGVIGDCDRAVIEVDAAR